MSEVARKRSVDNSYARWEASKQSKRESLLFTSSSTLFQLLPPTYPLFLYILSLSFQRALLCFSIYCNMGTVPIFLRSSTAYSEYLVKGRVGKLRLPRYEKVWHEGMTRRDWLRLLISLYPRE